MNNPTLIKFTANLYAPGAVLQPNVFRWMSQWDYFQSRRILFPVEPLGNMTKFDDVTGDIIVTHDICHIRITPIDDTYAGAADGVLDNVLAGTRLDFFLGDELRRIVNSALLKAPPYRQMLTFTSWLELWDCDTGNGTGRYFREIAMKEIVELTNKTP